MTNSNLVKAVHKDNSLTDWNSSLKSVWESDSARPWNIYAVEQSRHNWDIRQVEHRTK